MRPYSSIVVVASAKIDVLLPHHRYGGGDTEGSLDL